VRIAPPPRSREKRLPTAQKIQAERAVVLVIPISLLSAGQRPTNRAKLAASGETNSAMCRAGPVLRVTGRSTRPMRPVRPKPTIRPCRNSLPKWELTEPKTLAPR
jgi:hypothetical protein